MFHDTIKHNIKYGNLEADDETVYKAAKMAELHQSILDWPSGYQTQVNIKTQNIIREVFKKIKKILLGKYSKKIKKK